MDMSDNDIHTNMSMDMSDNDMQKVHIITNAVMEQLITDGFAKHMNRVLQKATRGATAVVKNVEKFENKTGGIIHHISKRTGEASRFLAGTTLETLHKTEKKQMAAIRETSGQMTGGHFDAKLQRAFDMQKAALAKTRTQIKVEEQRLKQTKHRVVSNVFATPDKKKSIPKRPVKQADSDDDMMSGQYDDAGDGQDDFHDAEEDPGDFHDTEEQEEVEDPRSASMPNRKSLVSHTQQKHKFHSV
jgi:hypothetical protein